MAKATAATLICLFAVSFVCAQNATSLDAAPDAVALSNATELVKPLANTVTSGAPEKATEATLNVTIPSSPIPGSGPQGGSTPKQAIEKNGSTFVLASSLLIALSVVLCFSN